MTLLPYERRKRLGDWEATTGSVNAPPKAKPAAKAPSSAGGATKKAVGKAAKK
jgi:hypothetical protein